MSRVAINTGAAANDGTGDTLRAAGGIINDNFLEIYTYLGAGSTTTLSAPVWNTTNAGINTLRNVGVGTTNPRFTLEVGAVGASGTTLFVNGDARITGIVTIGTSSITLNGSSNTINVGTGITINGSTGIISATSIVLGGTTLTGAAVTSITAGSGISVDQSTGNVTITATGGGGSSQWVTTAAGIHTLSNVGVGTTNPTSALTVKGNTSLETLNVSGVSTLTTTDFTGHITLKGTSGSSSLYVLDDNSAVFGDGNDLTISHNSFNSVTRIREDGGNLEISANPIKLQHSDSTKLETLGAGVTVTGTTFTNQLNVSGVTTTSTLSVGTGSSIIHTNAYGVGIGTTNPLSGYNLTVGASSGIRTEALKVYGYGDINGLTIKGNSRDYTDNVIITQNPSTTFYGNRNVAIGDYSFTTPGAAGENVAIGYYALNVVGNNDAGNTYNGNIGVGAFAGQSITTTLRSTFVGYGAGRYVTTGSENTILGAYDGNSKGLDIRTSSNNVVLSDGAGNIRFYANSSGNVGLGTTNPLSGHALTVAGITTTNGLYISGITTFRGRLDLGEPSEQPGSSIYYIQPNTVINNNYSGGKIRLSAPSGIEMLSGTGETIAYFADNPSHIGYVRLYHNNFKKFETIGAGVTVTGITFTNQLNVSGVSTFVGNVGIGTTNATSKLTVSGGDISVGVSTAHGVILTSENGTQYRLIVDNAGALSTVAV